MTDLTSAGTVLVRVPASSANLGPGYDAMGLALGSYDEVEMAAAAPGAGTTVEITGEGAGELPADETHLVAASALAWLRAAGLDAPAVRLRCRNRIPQSRGLGSSAAAIVAGVAGAHALLEAGSGAVPASGPDLLAFAAGLEGHPDNVAACLSGGATICWLDGDRARAVRLEPHPRLVPIVFIPAYAVSTAAARAALPTEVPHADAARNAGRAALLVHALTTAPDLLLPATEDWLHQGYRRTVLAGSVDLVDRLRTAGVAAVVSGAGPTVLALAADPAAVGTAKQTAPAGWRVVEPGIDRAGVTVTPAAGG